MRDDADLREQADGEARHVGEETAVGPKRAAGQRWFFRSCRVADYCGRFAVRHRAEILRCDRKIAGGQGAQRADQDDADDHRSHGKAGQCDEEDPDRREQDAADVRTTGRSPC